MHLRTFIITSNKNKRLQRVQHNQVFGSVSRFKKKTTINYDTNLEAGHLMTKLKFARILSKTN